jgi:hypothetical protein
MLCDADLKSLKKLSLEKSLKKRHESELKTISAIFGVSSPDISELQLRWFKFE